MCVIASCSCRAGTTAWTRKDRMQVLQRRPARGDFDALLFFVVAGLLKAINQSVQKHDFLSASCFFFFLPYLLLLVWVKKHPTEGVFAELGSLSGKHGVEGLMHHMFNEIHEVCCIKFLDSRGRLFCRIGHHASMLRKSDGWSKNPAQDQNHLLSRLKSPLDC